MSDNWIAILPADLDYVPDVARREKALRYFWSIAPESDKIEVKISEKLMFFDCGANLEKITCSNCGGNVSTEWWRDQLENDYEEEYDELNLYILPCCGRQATMAELEYSWPQGFAKFAIDAMNPKIGTLLDEEKEMFETILETPIRVIYQHI